MKESINRFMGAMESEVGFIIAVIIFIAVLFALAILAEKNNKPQVNKTQKITLIGIFSALAAILMYVEFPLPFAPDFYKIDFSEVPVLISGFTCGPIAAVITEFLKILIKLLLKGTSTAFVGEFANFVVGCAFVIPATTIYWRKKNFKSAMAGMVSGTVIMTLVGCFTNAFILLPAFAYLFGGINVSDLVAMGTAVNPAIKDLFTFVLLAVTPLNILKGVLVTILEGLVYTPINKAFKSIMKID